jgi:hypothetical protein
LFVDERGETEQDAIDEIQAKKICSSEVAVECRNKWRM